MALSQKETDKLNKELKEFLDKKLKKHKKTDYVAIVSIVSDLKQDKKFNTIGMKAQFIRVGSITVKSPYMVMIGIKKALQNAMFELFQER